MYAEERQQAILLKAREAGRVEVEQLSETFAVSQETVRRDLNSLEKAGVVRRVHGGAIASERLTFEPALAERDRLNTYEKDAIARRAIEELPHTGAILVDSGSTTRRFAELIPGARELHVVTNAPAIGLALAARDDLTVLLLGGRLRRRTQATVDDWALHCVSQVNVDVAFIATNGLSVSRGLTTPDQAEAAIKRAMIAGARRVVVLADHTKIDDDYFARFGELSDIDLLITDNGLGDDATRELTAAGLAVARVDPLRR
jgi:DeoR family transcriptional regulator, fructose operon transcriptional repressor